MKEKKIFDAITNVSDELIEEASLTKLKKKGYVWQKWTAMVACALLIVTIGVLIPRGEDSSPWSGVMLDVTYPKAYAFEDHQARLAVMEQNPVDESIIAALNDFSYRTGSLILTEAGENINYSPLSLYYALSLAASGARNDTEEQLLALLGVPDAQFLSAQSRNLYHRLYKDNEIGKLKIANSIWMDNDMNGISIVFKEDYVEHAAKYFFASSHSVDFANKDTGKAMGRWISTNTNGTISPIIDTSPEQILSILNTVYFYDEWSDRFDKSKTAQDLFHLLDGNVVKNDFMNQIGWSDFAKGEGFTRAGLWLKNYNEMVFILPDEGVSPYELLSSPEQMRETFEGGEEFTGQVVWKIPKFSFSSKLEMTDSLKSLGLSQVFTADADFTGITEQKAFINSVRQETHIAIDENGVEASAFTQIDYAGSAPPTGRADMVLNRPFIYGIKAQNGSLLFVGVIENPAK